jgi:hypothetical protein
MRPYSTKAALIIAGVLAFLLIAYVFTGGRAARPDRAPHCTSQQALNLIKGELFRRAKSLRGSDDMGFNAVGGYSVLHPGSRLYRSRSGGSDKVDCAGSLVLDLPPGVAVAGGRGRLVATVKYQLLASPGRAPRLVALGNADEIVVPLASASKATRVEQPSAVEPKVENLQADTVAPTRAPAPYHMPGREPVAPRMSAVPARASPQQHAKPRASAPVASLTPEKRAARTQASAAANTTKTREISVPISRAAQAPPPNVTITRPSFNCRRARTRGEIAVCSNPALAAVDRQMSAQFYHALAAARPGQRAMLERSRNRFLRYRDSCRSDSCIADAYRGRMREISDVLNGAW